MIQTIICYTEATSKTYTNVHTDCTMESTLKT